MEFIGFVLLAYGVAATISSLACGYSVKRIGRIPMLIFGAIVSILLILAVLFIWTPDPSKPVVFYVISGLWGMVDSLWLIFINGIPFLIQIGLVFSY